MIGWSLLFGLTIGIVAAEVASSVATTGGNDSDAKARHEASSLSVLLTHQVETSSGSGTFHRIVANQNWDPKKTALILCDVWDSHHCKRAVDRLNEMIPRLDETTRKLRERGVTIIHAPSDCMMFYEQYAARLRVSQIPKSAHYPEDIDRWCYKIPAEEAGKYPIDQSNGGEDDDPQEHAEWLESLKNSGRNPKTPWLRQHAGIHIDERTDYVSDQGKEVWDILTSHGIDNVILAGVHTNMCVLGRPFGLRRMVSAGKNAVLIRDLTDTMYDPNSAPFVSHFTGTDLIIDHIERYVCPTFTSDQILGGTPFRFSQDQRPTIAMLIGEDEYETSKTLPPWSLEKLGKQFRVITVHGSETKPSDFPGIQAISDADLLIVSVRRRPLLPEQLKVVRDFEASGKPMLGIRTASHAFSLRKPSEASASLDSWPEFDRDVWGGSYTNHHANDAHPMVSRIDHSETHPIVAEWPSESIRSQGIRSQGSLYKVQPLAKEAQPILLGAIEGAMPEPVMWTFTRKNGGRSVYTSLGHQSDFEIAEFRDVLKASVDWLLYAKQQR